VWNFRNGREPFRGRAVFPALMATVATPCGCCPADSYEALLIVAFLITEITPK
jgi:hypothetical protein